MHAGRIGARRWQLPPKTSAGPRHPTPGIDLGDRPRAPKQGRRGVSADTSVVWYWLPIVAEPAAVVQYTCEQHSNVQGAMDAFPHTD